MSSVKKNDFWSKLGAGHNEAPATTTLTIRAAGLCCAVGYNLDAAICAMRTNMDHFQHSDFKTAQGERILVARLDDDHVWGQGRLARWISLAISDCLSAVETVDYNKIPLIWLAPESERSGADSAWYDGVFRQALDQLDVQFHDRSGVMALGRAGLSNALSQAAALLDAVDCEHVLLVGADTYLNAPTINAYLQAERLQVKGNSDGFIPGEAAAAILLKKNMPSSRSQSTHENGTPLINVIGYGVGNEPGRVDGSIPNKSQGLTKAIRSALIMSQIEFDSLDFRVSDQNGESFFSREAANAMTRVTPVGGGLSNLITIADSIGEVGAAMGPVMLAYMFKIMGQQGAPGGCGLLHLANDNGLRSAVIVNRSFN